MTAEAADNTPKVEQYPCARFKVSSRHLALSSPVFQHMIEGGLTNNRQHQPPSLTEVPLCNDDPEALLILLQAIHSQFKQVPREVDLETLTQIAILVDKYECLEVTEFLVEHWLRGVENTIPSEFNDICFRGYVSRLSSSDRAPFRSFAVWQHLRAADLSVRVTYPFRIRFRVQTLNDSYAYRELTPQQELTRAGNRSWAKYLLISNKPRTTCYANGYVLEASNATACF